MVQFGLILLRLKSIFSVLVFFICFSFFLNFFLNRIYEYGETLEATRRVFYIKKNSGGGDLILCSTHVHSTFGKSINILVIIMHKWCILHQNYMDTTTTPYNKPFFINNILVGTNKPFFFGLNYISSSFYFPLFPK